MKAFLMISLLASFSAVAGMYEQDCQLSLGRAAKQNEIKACQQIDSEKSLECVRHYGIGADAQIIEACQQVKTAGDLTCATMVGADINQCFLGL